MYKIENLKYFSCILFRFQLDFLITFFLFGILIFPIVCTLVDRRFTQQYKTTMMGRQLGGRNSRCDAAAAIRQQRWRCHRMMFVADRWRHCFCRTIAAVAAQEPCIAFGSCHSTANVQRWFFQTICWRCGSGHIYYWCFHIVHWCNFRTNAIQFGSF